MVVFKQSYETLSSEAFPNAIMASDIRTSGITDTGFSVMSKGDQIRSILKVPKYSLLKTNVTYGRWEKLTVMGVIPVNVKAPGTTNSYKQILHIVQEVTDLITSKLFLAELE